MSWEMYYSRVVVEQGIWLIGFPPGLRITDPGDYGRLQLMRIHEALTTGTCYWQIVPESEMKSITETSDEDTESEEVRAIGQKTKRRTRVPKRAIKRQKARNAVR